MAAKELKTELKSARDAIQNKDYQTALRHCKAALKLDQTNYNAFVFVGKASFELGKHEQAEAAYKKAININADSILAWQGLASLYEKFGNKDDIPEIYEKLIRHYECSDKRKWKEMVLKLADIRKVLKDVDKALQLLMLLITPETENDQYDIWCKIVSLLQENEGNLTTTQRNQCKVLKTWHYCDEGQKFTRVKQTCIIVLTLLGVNALILAYENILRSDNLEANNETQLYFGDYIKLLMKHKRERRDIISSAKRMRELFKDNEFSAGVLARIFVQEIQEMTKDECVIYQELLSVTSESPLGLLGLGKVKLFKNELTEAEELLQKGLNGSPTSASGWYFLSTVQISRHKYAEAEESAAKGLSCLRKEICFSDVDFIHFNLSLRMATACCYQGNEKMSSAVKYFEELSKLRPDNLDVHLGLGKAFVRLNDVKSAKKYLEICHDIQSTVPLWLSLEGEIYVAEEKYENAEKSFLRMIEVQNDAAENYVNLGKLYWKMEGHWRTDKDKCLANLLKAAKLDPFYSSTFLHLGHYYRDVASDLSKAHRCYKKAHDLNPLCDEAGEALGDSYTSLEQEEDAVQLYKKFTSMAGIARAKWAWLRLGLYYIRDERYNDSVQCLQNALRVDVKDPHSWECLGEAYMSRGSYTAALASFTRAVELDPSLVYSRYQKAAIKHLLGLLDEAVSAYNEILAEHCDYVPALKGLGETYIAYVHSALFKDFHDRAVVYVQAAILTLARAIEVRCNLSCLWKLLGDVCSLVFRIHENKIRIKLPMNLKRFLSFGMDARVSKIDVLSLAASSYGQAARYYPRCSGLWHDLGLSYYRLSQSAHNSFTEQQRLCERSVKALKKGLSIEPDNYNIWNTLGIVAASNEISNPELSQHAFIKSLQSQKNAMAWTNLGVLYLLQGKPEMANRAFNGAQCSDPSFTEAWIGQATIAELFGHNESMDLYRHSNELGTHVEAYLGYGHWVCQTLLCTNGSQQTCVCKGKPFADLSHISAKYRSIVLIASVGLTKYTDQVQDNPCAFNMHGILLEHQQLYSQAEAAYARSVKLLESYDKPKTDFLNIVRANYARVLRTLGKHSESVKAYQKIIPLKDFNHIIGLALAFYFAGQYSESFKAYEEAFQFATSDAHKSHIRAAMGMLQYVLDDMTGCQKMLLESSQMRPASEQGLLALSAVGLITTNLSLAAAALMELLNVGHEGNESLVAAASYLFATFYALQGRPSIGKSYIVAEIHRRPQSSMLWNKLATYMLRFQPNKLSQVSQCAEAAHRLGDRNVKGMLSTYAYSTIGVGRSQISGNKCSHSGVVAAQKAVHMEPDSLANWTLLIAAVTDVSFNKETRAREKYKHDLCVTVTQFVSKAFETSRKSTVASQMCGRRRLQVIESNQKWLALHLGYLFHYSRRREEAETHCEQVVQIWDKDPDVFARIQLLLVEIRSSRENVEPSTLLDHVLKVLMLNQKFCYAWLFTASFYQRHGYAKAAECCYRNCLHVASKEGSLHSRIAALVRLGHLALSQALTQDDKSYWLNLMLEASREAAKLFPGCQAALLLQGISHYMNDHIREAKDLLHTIDKRYSSFDAVTSFYLVLLSLRKRGKGETLKDVIKSGTRNLVGRHLQDLVLYFLAMNTERCQRKPLLLKCIHVNPREERFWDALSIL